MSTSRPTSTDDLRFFDPRGAIAHGANRLPHWNQSGVACFVTFRLADSIPQERLSAWATERRSWLTRNPPPHTAEQDREHDELFTVRIEEWLDQGAGSCALREPVAREIASRVLMRFDGQRYWLHSWVEMPNHVHLLFSPLGDQTLDTLLRSWKGVSAREINLLHGHTGDFWMRDYFDRLARDSTHFWRCARYIRRNPEKAKLSASAYTLYEAPFVCDFLDAERSGGTPAAVPAPDSPGRQECRRSV